MLVSKLALVLSLLSPLTYSAVLLPSTRSSTLVDALSADPDYSLLLHLVQRAKLVPTLNKLNGSTLFAPTNDAIERHRKETQKSIWSLALSDETATDNVNYELRQHLLYHMLNYSINAIPETIIPQHTLHFPELPLGPPTGDPPPSPPWLPIPGGLLGGEPQRLRTLRRDDGEFIGVDALGQGGAKIVKEMIQTSNGNVFGVDGVVNLPLNLFKEIQNSPSLSVISRLLPKSLQDSLSSSPHLTLFFPVDDAWDVLDPIERRYLESGFAENDMSKIVGLHASGKGADGHGLVGWSETWAGDSTTNFTTIEGHTVRVNITEDGATVSGRPILDRDIYGSNGVLHTVGSLLLSKDTFQLNAEKYLLALNATSFVSLLRAANLSHYVDDYHDGKPWTILAPRDDVFTMGNTPLLSIANNILEGDDKPSVNMTELRRILQYHFIPGKLQPKELENGSLVGTELHEEGLGGGRQSVEVSVHGRGDGGIVLGKGEGEIGFSGALVIGDAVEIGDSIIYVISKALTPPSDPIESALPKAYFSTFLTSVFATHMDDVLRTYPSTTLLIPHNNVWSPLGLLTDYLLLPESRESLKSVISHHVIKDVIYPGDGILGTSEFKTYSTLEGSDVRISNGQITASGGWTSSTADSTIKIVNAGILTSSGVIHETRGGLLIPRSVQVNIENLATAGQGSIMIGLVQKAGYGGVLNGTMKLDLDEWEYDVIRKHSQPAGRDGEKKRKKEEVGWTLLCPRDDAFKGVNLTRMLADEEGLKFFVRQHIIPVPATESSESWEHLNTWSRKIDDEDTDGERQARPIPFTDEATFSTLLSANSVHGDIVFRLTGSNVNSFLIGIKGASGKEGATDFARVLKWGRTVISSTTSVPPPKSLEPNMDGQEPLFPINRGDSNPLLVGDRPTSLRSGVILIDRPLTPFIEGWWAAWGQAIFVGIVGSVMIVGSWTGVVFWWRSMESEATFEPLDGSGDD